MLSTTVLTKQNFHTFVLPVVVRFENFKSKYDCDERFHKIEDLFKRKISYLKLGKYGNVDPEILDVLSGPQYP